MGSTVVYQQGFQSYLESQLHEPRALRLRLSSPNPHFSHSFGLALKSHSLDSSNVEKTRNRNDDNIASGSSSLSNTTSTDEKEKSTYVQRSSSCRILSEQGLALCTENLGSESGSDVTDVEDLFTFSLSDVIKKTKNHGETRSLKSKKVNYVSSGNLPPPLTSMRGSQYIQMRPHREDGRLVMTATKAPPRNQLLQAERSDGRLRLSILKDSEELIEPEVTDEYEKEEQEYDDDVMDLENVKRSRRCLEVNDRELLNWESFPVATS